jgi:hypothetical protein
VAAACLAGCLLVATAAIARADSLPIPITPGGDPTNGAADQTLAPAESPGETTGVDTEYTPVAKQSAAWLRIAGAEYPSKKAPADSQVPDSVDFFSVSFDGQARGFAGGTDCADRSDPKTCTPVIYGYTDREGVGPRWDRLPIDGSAGGQGYVAAIARLDDSRFIAAGGDGVYPRREDGVGVDTAGSPDPSQDPAGHARAWLYDGSSWSDITKDQPDGMGALTALDCSPDGKELCFAGGLRQLWTWQDGKFLDTPLTDKSPNSEVYDGSTWRFRLRELRFSPDLANPQLNPGFKAAAVTSGCCDLAPALDTPRMLLWDGKRWYVTLLTGDAKYLADKLAFPIAKPVADPLLNNFPGGVTTPAETPSEASALRELAGPKTLPDSLYAFTFTRGSPGLGCTGESQCAFSLVATSGGSRPAAPASRIVGNVSPITVCSVYGGGPLCDAFRLAGFDGGISFTTGDLVPELATLPLSEVRLNAGDGDFMSGPSLHGAVGQKLVPDGYIDWAVGELRDSHRGIAVTTTAAGNPPLPSDCPQNADQSTVIQGGCSLNLDTSREQKAQEAMASKSVVQLPTWTLNSMTMLDAGLGWAVGDRGAIVRFGGEGTATGIGNEPSAAQVSHGAPTRLPGSSAYKPVDDSHRSTGSVPGLGEVGKQQQVDRPAWVPAGSPDLSRSAFVPFRDVHSIAMSRDGSEGWALGKTAAVYHYDGESWNACDPEGIRGQIRSDPACTAFADFESYLDKNHQHKPVDFREVTRIPTENDSDPTNDDEFEAEAIGSLYRDSAEQQETSVIVRYSSGHWALDRDAMTADVAANGDQSDVELSSVAFPSPSDGWIVGASGALHYDGVAWINCNTGPVACGEDPANPVLPKASSVAIATTKLLSVGRQVFAYSTNRKDSSPPQILTEDPAQPCDGIKGHPGCWRVMYSGASSDRMDSLSLAHAGGGIEGWASGKFASSDGTSSTLLRLAPGKSEWRPWTAADDSSIHPAPGQVVDLGDAGGHVTALALGIEPADHIGCGKDPVLQFNADSQRWEVSETPVALSSFSDGASCGAPTTAAPDNAGGLWMPVAQGWRGGFDPKVRFGATFFYHFTHQPPKAIFSEVPNPVVAPEQVTDLSGSADGSVWLSTDSSSLYHYSRVAGWDRVKVPGWQAGRVATGSAGVNALAVGPKGDGLAVGSRGRIADLTPDSVGLDAAAGVLCSKVANAPPCGTGRDLRSAAVAEDGSALVGGDDRTLLYRPRGASFASIPPPTAPVAATFTGISMPKPTEAWIAADTGQIFHGSLNAEGWSWRLENLDTGGHVLAANGRGGTLAVNDIAIDRNGHGFAVGDEGLVLQRTGDGSHPWSRLADVPAGKSDLLSVAIPANDSSQGALIGGEYGLVLTYEREHFHVAHEMDPWSGATAAPAPTRGYYSSVPGVALVPGTGDGQVEAWAAETLPPAAHNRLPVPNALLHYSSDSDDQLLQPADRALSLADAPPGDNRDLSFAAFGDEACLVYSSETGPGNNRCPELTGSNAFTDLMSKRLVEAITTAHPDFSLFTGDVSRSVSDFTSVTDAALNGGSTDAAGAVQDKVAGVQRSYLKERAGDLRWREQVLDPIARSGVPTFAALGPQDLSGSTGLTLAWRQAMKDMPAPWGLGGPAKTDRYSFEPVVDPVPSAEPGDQEVADPSGQLGSQKVPLGGAHTHYALDLTNPDGEKVLRVVVADNSSKSLAGSDGAQNPFEEQQTWLRQMLCTVGSSDDRPRLPCSRPAGERAIVVANTPSYAFDPSASNGGNDTAPDATTFEALMLSEGVDAVISGRLGWNAVYWTLAPGLHQPCPADPFPDPNRPPPAGEAPNCGGSSSGADANGVISSTANEVQKATGGSAAGAMPTIIAASAGSPYGGEGNVSGSARDGYWHGYTMVHLNRQTGAISIEERPILDWLRISGATHLLRPAQAISLLGEGREPLGTDYPAIYDEISTPAITHRFDLVLADPYKPWLPKDGDVADACDPYDCLATGIGSIDQSGKVTAGGGNYERTFALALLSVGDKEATYPLVFEPRPSFRQPPAPAPIPLPPANAPPPAPAPPAPAPPFNPPTLATPPPVAPLPAQTPPVPPAPPAPPGAGPAQLDLFTSPPVLSVAPTISLFPPSPPVINVAPPTPARPVEKAKKVAVQSSGSDSDAKAGASEEGVNRMADETRGSAGDLGMSRHDPNAFTAVAHREQASAWARDLQWGGGLTLMALVAAFGWITVRPTPRRRMPEVPAPAFSRQRRR